MRLAACVLALAGLAGCSGSERSESSVTSSAVALGTALLSSVPREKRAALERCISAGNEAGKRAVACADLYSQPSCAEAFSAWDRNHPAERAAVIGRACRDAYCPRLSEPKPRLCSEPELPPPSVQLALWPELNRSIPALELGLSLEQVQSLFPAPAAASMAVPPSAPPLDGGGSSVVTLELGLDEHGRAYVAIDGDGPVTLPAGAPEATLLDVAERARRKVGGSSASAVIRADRKAPYRSVRDLTAALRAVQFVHVTLANDPSVDFGAAPTR